MKRTMSGLAALLFILCTGISAHAQGIEWKKLNDEWRDVFKTNKPLAYHEKSDILSRERESDLVKLKQKVFSKYGLGDVPVSDYEYKLWLRSTDTRTPKLDKLRISSSLAYDKFSKSLTADIEASPERKLRYAKEGELDGFSPKTQALYRVRKAISKKIAELETGWPAESPGKSVDTRPAYQMTWPEYEVMQKDETD